MGAGLRDYGNRRRQLFCDHGNYPVESVTYDDPGNYIAQLIESELKPLAQLPGVVGSFTASFFEVGAGHIVNFVVAATVAAVRNNPKLAIKEIEKELERLKYRLNDLVERAPVEYEGRVASHIKFLDSRSPKS